MALVQRLDCSVNIAFRQTICGLTAEPNRE